MGICLYLASSEGGIGLNFDILETNLLNLIIIIGVLIYFGRSFLGSKLGERRAGIETTITEAEQRAAKASATLAEAQQKLAQAQAEAERIRTEAQTTAQRAKEEVLTKGTADVEKIKAAAAADLSSEQDRAIAELRQRISAIALQKAEAQLQDRLQDQSVQTRLVDRCIAQIGG
jgi:F-type H+-transporting ATPase subunit b